MLFADGPFQSVEFLVTVALLIGALLAGAAVIYVTDIWRKKAATPAREGIESLSMYRAMYECGELSEPEYRVIRDRFARMVKPDGPAAPPAVAEYAGEASGANLAGPAAPPAPHPPRDEPIS